MTALALVAAVRALGVRLYLERDAIMAAPAGRLTPELRDALRAAKPDVVALLGRERDACAVCGSTTWTVSLVDDALNRTCYACLTGATALRRAGVPL